MSVIRTLGGSEVAPVIDHGRRIFVYRHIQMNRIVYSLTRTLDMYFLGKKTVGTRRLRKDLWTPFAIVTFPSSFQGLSAFQQLREYAKRHLMEWTEADINERLEFDGMPKLMTRREVKERHEKARLRRAEITVTVKKRKTDRKWLRQELGPALTDQKANSVADLARVMEFQSKEASVAVEGNAEEQTKNDEEIARATQRLTELLQMRKDLEGKEDEESRQKYREVKLEKMKIQKALKKPVPWAALRGKYHMMNDGRVPAKRGHLRRLRLRDRPSFTMNGVKIEWADVLDRGFAESWPTDVVHAKISEGGNYWRNTAPVAESLAEEERDALVVENAVDEPVQLDEPEVEQTRLQRLISRLRFGSAEPSASRGVSVS